MRLLLWAMILVKDVSHNTEIKAFKRLARKIKKAFPRLPIILLGDSLYASEPVMDICQGNGWEYIIRYKTGSIPSITEEYEKIPEKETSGHADHQKECREDSRCRKETLENRERGLQPSEELAGGYYACLQLGCHGDEEPLPDDADIGYGKAAV